MGWSLMTVVVLILRKSKLRSKYHLKENLSELFEFKIVVCVVKSEQNTAKFVYICVYNQKKTTKHFTTIYFSILGVRLLFFFCFC